MSTPPTTALTRETLWAWPLPPPDEEGDKESRGRVLVVAGSREMPGAAVLAATAALRAGAGKLTVAVPVSIASSVAAALPEARVLALGETRGGGPTAKLPAAFKACVARADALVVGPGMADGPATAAFVAALLPLRAAGTVVVLDALALEAVDGCGRLNASVVLTPHAGELARLHGEAKAWIQAHPVEAARQAAERYGAVVLAKGASTGIAAPDGRTWCHRAAIPGLAASGSGDVLAGAIGGLAARGADAAQAAAWGVAAHAASGEALSQRIGPIGFLARELCGEIPGALHRLADASRAGW